MSRIRGGWPMLLADLALILFVATAVQAAHSESRGAGQTGLQGEMPAAPGVPQAFYADGPDAPRFDEWIAQQNLETSARVTIMASYRPGAAESALKRAQSFARDAQAAGRQPRILVEPGDGRTRAVLSYDETNP